MFAGLAVEYEEHVLLVLAPVSGLLPQRLVVQQRRLDFLERLLLTLAHERFERVVHRGALGRPEHGAGRDGEQLKEVERLPEHAMVALFGFFEIVQV